MSDVMRPKLGETVNFIQAINAALFDAMADDPTVLCFGEDVADPEGGGVMGVTAGLSGAFGNSRVRSTPIAEQAIIGAAIGASLVGWRPVAEIMLMNFMTVAMDQIVNHAAKLRFMSGGQTHVPLVIRTMTGTGIGNGGQHSDMLEAWFCHTAGLKVVAPSSPAEAYGLLRSSIEDEDPVIFVENMPNYGRTGPAPERGLRIPLGKLSVARAGTDVTLVAYGRSVADCISAADQLAKDGVSAEVLDLRSVAPIDWEGIFASAAKTRSLVTVHEAVTPHGVGAEISARVHEELFDTLRRPVQRVGSAFCPVPFSKPLETGFLYSTDAIVSAVRRTLEGVPA